MGIKTTGLKSDLKWNRGVAHVSGTHSLNQQRWWQKLTRTLATISKRLFLFLALWTVENTLRVGSTTSDICFIS